jgi:hypothetical protein
MSGQWPPEWDDSDTGLPDDWTVEDAGLDREAPAVTLFLASAPSPVLPASFEARISAAIAAEATARANGTAPARTASAGTEHPGTVLAGTETASTEPASAEPAGMALAGNGSIGTGSIGTGSADLGIADGESDGAKTTDRSSSPEFSPVAAESGSATAAKHRRRRTSGASRSSSTASRSAARGSGPTGSRPGGRRRRFRLPSSAVTAPLMIVLVIVGFAALLTQLGGSSSSSSSSPAMSEPAAGTGSGTTAPTSAHSTFSEPVYAGSGPQYQTGRQSAHGPNADFAVTRSGTNYQGATLASQVRVELGALNAPAPAPTASSAPNSASKTPSASGNVSSSASAASSASASGPASTAGSASRLAGCVSRVTDGVTPSLVDQASYDGIPAYIIAIPSRAWVVRLGCTAADPQEITSVSLKGLPGNLSALGSVEGYASPGERRMQ